MKPFKYSRQIAIVGLHNSGKTVLLTSLLDQLKNFRREKFKLTRPRNCKKPTEAEIKSFTLLPVSFPASPSRIRKTLSKIPGIPAPKHALHLEEFPFESYRAALVENGDWPQKTAKSYAIRCQFRRTDSSRLYDITFLDVPGERFTDIDMYRTSYEDWCSSVFQALHTSLRSRKLLEQYNSFMQNTPEVNENTIVFEYKKLLGRLLREYRPFITPSFYLLDEEGKQPQCQPESEEDIERLAHERITGLTREQQFAPLNSSAREMFPEIAARFSEQYTAYRDECVDPLFTMLKKSHRLVAVIDIPGLLCDHVGTFNDTHTLLKNVVKKIMPGHNRITPLKRYINSLYTWKEIQRVAFVASKCDIVWHDDNGEQLSRLKCLTKDLFNNIIRECPRPRIFTCAAIASTDPAQQGYYGFPVYDENNMKQPHPTRNDAPKYVKTSILPEEPEDSWEYGEYTFPEVYARVPANIAKPPRHVNVDNLFNFLIEEKIFE